MRIEVEPAATPVIRCDKQAIDARNGRFASKVIGLSLSPVLCLYCPGRSEAQDAG